MLSKLGQPIEFTNLFPDEYVSEFQKCFIEPPAVPFTIIREIIADELGKPVEDIFEKVDPVPPPGLRGTGPHAAVLKGSKKTLSSKF